MKLFAIIKEEEDYYRIELRHKNPREYMCSWTFEMIFKYAKEELYWQDLLDKNIISFVIKNEREQWEVNIKKNEIRIKK